MATKSIKISKKYNCVGCMACYNVCPKKAIFFREDGKGFKYPVVDKNKCVNCGLCKKVCPVINKIEVKRDRHAYACINLDETTRMQSSSGGVFSLLANTVLDIGGIVFGCEFDEDWNVIHGYAETKEKIKKFRGSKYVQSNIGYMYKQAEEFLKQGRMVLFTGTPCQVYGLKTFLRKEYSNLITQDIVCHGVPSPKVWKEYLKYIKEKNHLKKIQEFNFRNKNQRVGKL